MIGAMVDDVLAETERRLRGGRQVALARGRARAWTATLVAFSARHGWRTWRVLRAFLLERMYRH